MHWIQRKPITLTILVTSIFVLIMLVWGRIIYGSSFIQDFASNWLSTLLGVVVGIPVALWINKWAEENTEKERKKKILTLLDEELTVNLDEINHWWELSQKQADITGILSVVLRDEIWRSFSDGGELKWIKDPELLSQIADAYQNVQILKKMSDRYGDNPYYRWEHFVDMYKNSERTIRDTLQIIKEKST